MEKISVDIALVKQLQQLLEQNDDEQLQRLLDEMYPQDIAEILDRMKADEARHIMHLVDKEKAIKVLVEMEENVRENFLSSYSVKEIADEFIQNMDSDDAAYVLNNFSVKDKEDVISNLSDIEFASSLLSLLNYEEYTAGSLMAVELVKANINWSVSQCIEEIRRQAENVENIYVVYVVDDFERLTGIITLKNLILSNPTAHISDVYNDEVISVSTSTDSEEIANLFKKYDLVVLPVVNALGQLVGRITVDDVVEVIKEEANEDYQLMSGITEDVDSSDKVWVLSRARLPWLLIGLMGGVASSRFIEIYEEQLRIHPEMAFFMPLIAAMGGNAGVQSSAIVVQGLANNTLGTKNILPKIWKELRVGLLNGLICSLLLLGYNIAFSNSMNLSMTVSIALISVIVFATVLGTFIPLVLNKMKIDPAIATGPFITTTNDLLGLVVYFALGHLLYNVF
ncbi:magnesium transporter [Bacteroidetes bacterium UKL13-3]|jgi:magnesium transporter|nr:magnesium transporter [Bacteroidetes bacterium UKL13-3]HCP94933.1 magnesium transporter [Bacteroidota bacterium]